MKTKTYKTCNACQQLFACHANKITECECHHIQLSLPQLEWLRTQFKDCICLSCLKKLKNTKDLKSFYIE